MSIKLEHVTYTYSPGTAYEIHALKDVSLEIPQGQFLGVIGHTGSGKSTLIQHFNGLMRPTSGRVLYNGADIWGENYKLRELRFHVGLVFQYPEHQLFEIGCDYRRLLSARKTRELSPEECRKRRSVRCSMWGFRRSCTKNRRSIFPEGRSGEWPSPVVLAMNPDVLILDEPTAGLDPKGRDEILDRISICMRHGELRSFWFPTVWRMSPGMWNGSSL